MTEPTAKVNTANDTVPVANPAPDWNVQAAVITTALAVFGSVAGSDGDAGIFIFVLILNPFGWAAAYLWWRNSRITCPHCGKKNPRIHAHPTVDTRQTCRLCRADFALVRLEKNSPRARPVASASLKQTATKEDEAPPTKVQQVEEQQLGPSDADVKEVSTIDGRQEEASYAAPEVAIDSAIELRKMFDSDATGSDRNSESRQDYSTPPTPVTEPERSHNFHSGVVISFFHGRCSHIIYRIRDHARREG
jgi:hypothetical protein